MPSALDVATKLLSGRDKTRAQLEQALLKKGFDAVVTAETISRATELGYLDDVRVAKRRALDGLREGWAGDALLQRLLAPGLDELTAEAAIDEAKIELRWNAPDAARALLVKRRLEGPRAARFLVSRGFEEDTISALVQL